MKSFPLRATFQKGIFAGLLTVAMAIQAQEVVDTAAAHTDSTTAAALPDTSKSSVVAKTVVADSVVSLPIQKVTGRKRAPSRIVDATALKLSATLHETPRSITVLSSERLRDQNMTTVASTMDYVPGFFKNSNAREGYHYYSRGYRMAAVDTRVDGFAGINAGGDMSSNLFGVEQVTFLRGPAGILYGASGAPGGMVNVVTKKPQAIPGRQFDFRIGPFGGSSVGNSGGYGIDADMTGPLGDDGRVLYRSLATVENMNQFTANVEDKNRFGALSLTYKLDGEGRYAFTPMASYTQLARPDGRGISISPSTSRSANDNQDGIHFEDLSPMDVNLSSGGREDRQFLSGFDFTAAPNEKVKFQIGYRYLNYDSEVNQFSPDTATLKRATVGDDKSWTVQRRQSRSVIERWSHSFDVNGSYEFKPEATTWWKNVTQLGVNGRWNGNDRSASATAKYSQSPINIYTGVVTSALKNDTLPLTEAALTSAFAFNFYAQDQISLDNNRWIATLGLGYAQETPNRDYRPTSINADTVRDQKAFTSTKYGTPTPNAALLFNASKSLALYVSYASSYTLAPMERENKAGESGVFGPERGDSYETGLKYDLPSLAASFNLAVFHIERFNVMTQSPTSDLNSHGIRYYTQKDGEGVISRGVELSGEMQPLRNWRVSAGGAYLLAEYQSDLDKVSDGAPADKSPEWSGNLFTRYDLANGPVRGLGASLGATYQGERLSAIRTTTAPDPLVLPYFIRVDAGVYYRANNNIDFAFNIENLNDDRRIALDGTTGTNIEMGAPRRISFRTGYRM